MTLDEAITFYERQTEALYTAIPCDGCPFDKCKEEHHQLAKWLKELKALRDFANFVAESVMDEEFEENSGFYAEVYCRKLHKMGFIEAEDNKWIFNKDEVKTDDGDSN